MAGRTIAIGDIHGCRDKLAQLIDYLQPGPEDKLVFLGDYIDRGEDSAGVITDLIKLSKTVPCIFLRGNHEDMFLRCLRNEPHMDEQFLRNGGSATLKSYGHQSIPEDHRAFLDATQIYYQEGDTFFVHAGLDPNNGPLENQDEDDLLWIRWEYLNNTHHPWDFRIVSGHTVHEQPTTYGEGARILIDTGAVGYGNLCAFDLTNDKFVIHTRSGDVIEKENEQEPFLCAANGPR